MQVNLTLLGGLQWYTDEKKRNLEIELGKKNISVKELLENLQIPLAEVQLVAVNGQKESLEYILAEHDRVEVLPVIAGG